MSATPKKKRGRKPHESLARPHRLMIRLSEAERNRVQLLALRDGRSQADIIRRMLDGPLAAQLAKENGNG